MPTVKHYPEAHCFVLSHENEIAGELDYRLADGMFNIVHTRVDPKFRGQGLAKHLLDAAVAEAGKLGLPLEAECGYAEEVLTREGLLAR
ncbi:GNAT family N-acetyltransferase [Neisseria chenwenguii]|uniref:GNAT family N-acetyltransferase n=1 Tax=Neisseria chenwenguii TaxID=1853278 RepID=A0A220RZK4_9NEIS|nr:GNAT family N-acetyltransferase [Neisseria chenwenguii]ASK26603.1 GNAT family N-acetyltransferase [Neisseria chenwenguii]ROV55385.1 N-acetyltransferase [Neisseria chenwenguii]